MAQIQDPTPHQLVASVDTGTTLSNYYNEFISAWLSNNSGNRAPAYGIEGSLWADTSHHQLKVKLSGSWLTLVTTSGSKLSSSLLPSSSTSVAGIVRLSTSHTSTSTSMAATPSAVKAAYDLAQAAQNSANQKAQATHTHSASQITSGVLAYQRIPSAVAGTSSAARKGAVRLVWDNANKVLDIRTD